METYAASVLAEVQVAYHASPALACIILALGTTLFGNLVSVPAILLGLDGSLGPKGWVAGPVSVLAGHLFGDFVWFTLGRTLSETSAGEWIRERLPRHKRVEKFFESSSVYILSVAKLLATPTVPILFLLGWYRTEPHRYARLSLTSAAIWFVGVMAFSLAVYSGLRALF